MSNDRSYLGTLQDYYARHRVLPSYASIGGLLGLRSKSSVAALVARFKLAGILESTPDRRLAPTKRFFARPIASGFVRAGLPDPVTDDEPDAVTLDDYLIRPQNISVPKGQELAVKVSNRGRLGHTFRIRGRNKNVLAFTTLQPGETKSRKFKLAKGKYTMYCALANHEELGMYGTLVVG